MSSGFSRQTQTENKAISLLSGWHRPAEQTMGAFNPVGSNRYVRPSPQNGGGLALAYDAENRLVSAGNISYTYDRWVGGLADAGRRDDGICLGWAHVVAEYVNGSLARNSSMGRDIVVVHASAWFLESTYR